MENRSFGPFRLDLANECLWKGTQSISLRPKAFAVLKLLVDHPGVLVTKQQVLDTVWPGTFVGDAVLKDSIRQLRQALQDAASSPSYIETAHRRGYRFIGKFSKASSPSSDNLNSSSLLPKTLSRSKSLFGREAELDRMQELLSRALHGDRQVVFITGEPGIGKTTFVETFVEGATTVASLLVARGQCFEHFGSGEAYLPVLDGFSRLCRSGQGPQVRAALRQFAPTWLSQIPSASVASEAEELRPPPPGGSRERMLREMGEAIEAIATESPLILVLEDLHWSDYSTVDLISYLARRRDTARLLIIGTYRPVDIILANHPMKGIKRELQAHSLCDELPLQYLTEDAVSDYLATAFNGHKFPTRLRNAIFARTEGNPLFMRNLVEYLTDRQLIVKEDGGWKLRADSSVLQDDVPGNLRQLIEKQLERLTPDERIVLEGASVVGMECSSVAIAAGIGTTTEHVEAQCETLARQHHLLTPAWLARLPDGTMTPRHNFTHVLYREVAYGLIPPMRRAEIHHAIAARGVQVYGNRDAEIATELAMHFEQSQDWTSALKYLHRAADNAIVRSAHHEAEDLARRGLAVLQSVPATPERDEHEVKLRILRGVSLMAIKGVAFLEGKEVFEGGLELVRSQPPSSDLFLILWSLAMYNQFLGELRPALELGDEVSRLAMELNDPPLLMESHRLKGAVLFALGRWKESLAHSQKASALYASHRNHPYTRFIGLDCGVISECFAARALWCLGDIEAATESMERGMSLARALGNPQTQVVATQLAAQFHHLKGDISLCKQLAQEAVKVADEYGLELWLASAMIELGWAEAELGNRKEGIERMQRAVAAYEATGARLWFSYFLYQLADQLVKSGRVDEALAVTAKAMAYVQESGERIAFLDLQQLTASLVPKEKTASGLL
jgi:DNA-binding winged helix-turn-helix (wHTH) protein/tetratricopeptide (TPR) repeat protein